MVSNVGDYFLLKLKLIYFGANLWFIDTRAKDNSCRRIRRVSATLVGTLFPSSILSNSDSFDLSFELLHNNY